MWETLQAKCEDFIINRGTARQVFRLSSPMMHCLCALQIAAADQDMPEERLIEGKRRYKAAFHAFSAMRGIAMPGMATLAALEKDTDGFLSALNRAYFEIRSAGFRATDYQPMTAWLLVTGASRLAWESLAAKARRLYLGMRERHPFLTSGEDACFALLLAMETGDEGETLERCEDAFRLLREKFRVSNATQTLAHILALEPENLAERCANTAELFGRLRELRCRFKRGMETTMLAALTYFYTDMGVAADDLALTYHRLRAHRGFSMMSVGRNQCAFYAACLLALEKARALPETEREKMQRLIRLIASVTVTLAAIQAAAAAAAS
ncbi:MAG: DUF4003 domain-containing protein [Clostridiales bacterium]|nr:DUF4003 domain-containing protein [Clostridiales bacterium]